MYASVRENNTITDIDHFTDTLTTCPRSRPRYLFTTQFNRGQQHLKLMQYPACQLTLEQTSPFVPQTVYVDFSDTSHDMTKYEDVHEKGGLSPNYHATQQTPLRERDAST